MTSWKATIFGSRFVAGPGGGHAGQADARTPRPMSILPLSICLTCYERRRRTGRWRGVVVGLDHPFEEAQKIDFFSRSGSP